MGEPSAVAEELPTRSTDEFRRGGRGRLILDRAADLDELTEAIGEVRDGEGQVVAIEGVAGIGKSLLLSELRRRSRDAGMRVLAAQGGELEGDYGFGVVRQLFGPILLGARDTDRDQVLAGAAQLAAPLFGMGAEPGRRTGGRTPTSPGCTACTGWWRTWPTRAVLLAVDDAQWADEPSLRFLDHLAHRLAGLPVLIAVTTRPAAEFDRPLLRSLVLAARSPVLRPRPLGEAAVAVLVRSKWDPSANDELCHACHDVSRGNPFLLTELLAELRIEAHSADSLDPRERAPTGPGPRRRRGADAHRPAGS